jgi:hypothetical protein
MLEAIKHRLGGAWYGWGGLDLLPLLFQLELAKGIILCYIGLVHKSLVGQWRPLVYEDANYVEGNGGQASGKLLAG